MLSWLTRCTQIQGTQEPCEASRSPGGGWSKSRWAEEGVGESARPGMVPGESQLWGPASPGTISPSLPAIRPGQETTSLRRIRNGRTVNSRLVQGLPRESNCTGGTRSTSTEESNGGGTKLFLHKDAYEATTRINSRQLELHSGACVQMMEREGKRITRSSRCDSASYKPS